MGGTAPGAAMVRVWDPLVRIFHWTLVTAFFGAFLFEDPRGLHETLGWIAFGAVAVRIVWGFTGSTHARFSDFVPWPMVFADYLVDTVQGRERRYLGHNPAGGVMVITLVGLVAVLGTTGWMMGLDAFWGSDWVEAVHEAAANVALGLVILHIVGVIWESRRHGENLVVAMITGLKRR